MHEKEISKMCEMDIDNIPLILYTNNVCTQKISTLMEMEVIP